MNGGQAPLVAGRPLGRAMPTSYFIDQAGVIRDKKLGSMEEAEIRQRLKPILP